MGRNPWTMEIGTMTKLLEEAFRKAAELSEDRQDLIGRMLLQVVSEGGTAYELSDEQVAVVKKSMAEAEAGNFAAAEAVEAVYAKHGA
jgi:hypothetical protein